MSAQVLDAFDHGEAADEVGKPRPQERLPPVSLTLATPRRTKSRRDPRDLLEGEELRGLQEAVVLS